MALDVQNSSQAAAETFNLADESNVFQEKIASSRANLTKNREIAERKNLLEKYISRQPAATLIQAALISKNPAEISYAKLYLNRCQESFDKTTLLVTPDSSRTQSASVEKAILEFRQFCAGVLGGRSISELINALNHASSTALAESEAHAGSDMSAVKAAAQLNDGELMIEAFGQASLEEKMTLSRRLGIEGVTDLTAPGLESAYDLLFAVAVCKRVGCDEDYRSARLCNSFGSCAAQNLYAQSKELFKQMVPQGTDVEAQWTQYAAQANRMLDGILSQSASGN